MSKYFKSTGAANLFLNDFVTDNALRHTNHFLTELNRIIDWEIYLDRFIEMYKGKAEEGRPMYKPTLTFKMLFLSYLFNISEREIERTVNDSISMKAFLGLTLEEGAPDHTTLTKFKNRFLEQDRLELLKEIFDEIIILAQDKGVELGLTQVIDSTHTLADVNRRKDKERREKESKPPRDPDAKTGVKRIKTIKTADGKTVKVPHYIYGYKTHTSVNAESNLITSLKVTSAEAYDGHIFETLMKEDISKDLTRYEETIYTADKAYDDGENHAWLFSFGLKNAICLKGTVEEEKVKRQLFYHRLTTDKEYAEGKKQRYIVERVYGDLKRHHGYGNCRYLGINKMRIQAYLTAITHNLKTLVTTLTGEKLRSPQCSHAF